MVTEYSDTRVLLRCVDPARVRDSLAALFAREGMRPVAVPGERPLYRDPIGSPNWRVALLIGIGEWSCLQYDPWTLLTKSAPGAEGSRFEELCLLLGCPGLLIDINNGGIHASLLIECDGRGSSRCSGYISPELAIEFYGRMPLPVDDMDLPRFELLGELQSIRDDGMNFESCGVRCDIDEVRAFVHLSDRLLGEAVANKLWDSQVADALNSGSPSTDPQLHCFYFAR